MRNRLKNLASDTMTYGIFTMVGRFLTFLLAPLYSNFLSMNEFGEFAFIFTAIPFINVIYSFGMESAFFRFYSKDDLSETKKVFTHAFLTMAAVSFIISALIFAFADSIALKVIELENGPLLIKITAFIPFLDTLMLVPYGLLRMTRQVRRFSIIRFSLVVIAVALNVLFVIILGQGLQGVLIAQAISSLIGALIFFRDILKHMLFKFERALFMQMLKFGIPTIPASFSAIILSVADKLILKSMADLSELAVYSMNYKLGIPMMLMVTMFEYAWKPFYLTHYEDKDSGSLFSRVLTYYTLLSAIIFLTVSLFIEFIVKMPFIGGRFINPNFWEGLYIIPIILGGYFFNGVFTNFAAGFHITKKTKYLPLAVGSAGILNITLNIIFIPTLGYEASAWATLIAYIFSALILYLFTLKIYPLKYEWKRLGLIIFSALGVYFAAIKLSAGMDIWLSFGIRAAAALTFVALLWLFKFFTPSEINGMKRLFRRG